MNFHQADVPEISVQELKALLESASPPLLLDVRQPHERDIASIGGELIPLDTLPDRLEALDGHKSEPIIVYCRSGARSTQAVRYMRAFGFDHATNLKGGILAWSREIDPAVPTY